MSNNQDEWEAATWEGLRRIQQEEFRKLSLAEKLDWLEDMAEVEAALRKSRRNRERRKNTLERSHEHDDIA